MVRIAYRKNRNPHCQTGPETLDSKAGPQTPNPKAGLRSLGPKTGPQTINLKVGLWILRQDPSDIYSLLSGYKGI